LEKIPLSRLAQWCEVNSPTMWYSVVCQQKFFVTTAKQTVGRLERLRESIS
jgi:hypothetical protein